MLDTDPREALATAARNPMLRLPTDPEEALISGWQASRLRFNSNAIRHGLNQEYNAWLDNYEKTTGSRLNNPMNYLGDTKDANRPELPSKFNAQIATINESVRRAQKEHPDLKPLDPEEMWQSTVTKAKAAGEDWALAHEYAGGWAKAASYTGLFGGGMLDPPTIAAMGGGLAAAPFTMGASLSAIATTIGVGAALNAGAEVLAEPGKRVTTRALGEPDRTLGDLAKDAATSAALGAVVEGGALAITHGVGAGIRQLRNLRYSEKPAERAAGIALDRAHETLVEDNPSAYSAKTAAAESGGDVTARSATSSAAGKFQFLEGTWNDLAKETGVPQVIEGQPDPRLNVDFQNKQMAAYTKRSTEALTAAGFQASDTNLYVTHFLGQDGGVNFLKGLQADPNAPALNYASAEAVAANREVFFKKGGTPKTAQEFYEWAGRKMGAQSPTGLPEQHINNYDTAMAAMTADEPIPDPGVIPGKARTPYVEGLETIDPNSLQVDARTFQFKEGGDALGVTDRLSGVQKWEPDFAGVALVYERQDGERFIADGHQRLALAKRFKAAGQDVTLNARILREADGWTPEAVRVRAAVKNIAEGTGSPLDAARVMRAARAADLPPLPPTSALVRQGRALSELADEPFQMVINKVIPENYGAIVGRLIKDPKLQEAAIKVLNKTQPENAMQAETIVRQVAETDMTTATQSTLFGDETISESLFLERAKVMDNALKALKKDKAVFSTLVNHADRIESAGNIVSRETNLERMTQDAKVSDLIQRLAGRKGPISDALTDAARQLKEGGRPGDATRSFIGSVRRAIDDGLERGDLGRNGGSLAEGERPRQPAEIRADQAALEKQPEDFFDKLIDDQVNDAFADGTLPKDSTVYIQDASGTMTKRKIADIMDDIKADKTLVDELTDCVEGAGAVS